MYLQNLVWDLKILGTDKDWRTISNLGIVRIGFQNIGGFPVNKNKHKEDIMRQGLMKWDFDVFGVAETNLDWRLCKEEEKLPLRTKEWWDHQHVSWTFNSNAPPYGTKTMRWHCCLF